MKVRVTLTVDVDLSAIRAEYGGDDMTADDVRLMVRSAAQSAVATDGVILPAGTIRSVDCDGLE